MLEFTLKTPWADGTTALLLSPQELLEKLAALVPPPRLHLIRYHGVLAPASADRAQIVPGPSALTAASDDGVCDGGCGPADNPGRHRHRVEWARLLARVVPDRGDSVPRLRRHDEDYRCPDRWGFGAEGRLAITGAADSAGSDRPTTGVRRCCLRSSSAVWPGTSSSGPMGKRHRCALFVVTGRCRPLQAVAGRVQPPGSAEHLARGSKCTARYDLEPIASTRPALMSLVRGCWTHDNGP